MTGDAAARKRALRAAVRGRRAARTTPERQDAARALTDRLVDLVSGRGAALVSCYLPAPAEPDTRGFLDWARLHGVGVLLPVCRDDGLLDWTRGEDGERAGPHGVPEAVGAPLGVDAVRDADLLLIPATAVARDGSRLGQGRGYFDKTLADVGKYSSVFAVVFADEFGGAVPRERHDRSVTGVVTPEGVFFLGGVDADPRPVADRD